MSVPFPYLGEISALLAAIAWAISLALFKAWGEGVPSVVLNLAKNGVAVTGLLIAAALLRPPLPGADAAYAMLVLSGIVGIAISDTFVLAGLSRVGTALTAASFCLSAPLSALLAHWLFGESLSVWEMAGIAIALSATAGVAWLGMGAQEAARASGKNFEVGLLFLFLAQIANTFGIVLGHGAFQHIDVLYGTLVRIVPAIAVLLPATWLRARRSARIRTRVPPRTVVMLGLGCVIGTLIGLVLMSMGLKYARAGIAASLNATYPVWAIPLSRLFLKEKLTAPMIGLMLLAVAGIALLFLA